MQATQVLFALHAGKAVGQYLSPVHGTQTFVSVSHAGAAPEQLVSFVQATQVFALQAGAVAGQ